jgi:hypothetical protein
MDVREGAQWVEPADLGPPYATIQVRLADKRPSIDHVMQDGEATLLPVGTTIYDVKGYAPTFRLAAEHHGEIVLYEVLNDSEARVRRDVLDISSKVREIVVVQAYEGELGRITDPEQVNRFVDLVVQAPVSGVTQVGGPRVYILDFHLHDGTMVSRPYNWDANLLGEITPPPEFQTELEHTISRFMTHSP